MSTFFNQETQSFFSQLLHTPGIAGNCDTVVSLLRKRCDHNGIQILEKNEGLGFFHAGLNLDSSFKVMLNAHMDTVGFRIKHIDEQGFCFIYPVGGVDTLSIKGQKVRIITRDGEVAGLIQGLPIHHMDVEARKKKPLMENYFVRTQYTGKGEGSIRIGDPVVFDADFSQLGEDILIGPGIDDRLGVLFMVELMRQAKHEKLSVGLYALGSCGEEIGCRGVRAATQKIKPDLAIILEVTNTTDYPQANTRKLGSEKMVCGPIITRGYNTRTKYTDQLITTAETSKIPYQIRAEEITATDGREVDEAGVATVVVRVPGTMLHTPNDCVHRQDIEWTFALLQEFLYRLPG